MTTKSLEHEIGSADGADVVALVRRSREERLRRRVDPAADEVILELEPRFTLDERHRGLEDVAPQHDPLRLQDRELLERLTVFMDEHVVPNEQVFLDQVRAMVWRLIHPTAE